MGRKNRNAGASSRNYNSFAELKNATVRFDLSNGNFIKKELSRQTATDNDEVRITFNDNGKVKDAYINFSIREDISETMKKGYGSHWICGVVTEGAFERLYFIPDEQAGYSMYRNQGNSKRYYLRMPTVNNCATLRKYLGSHNMMFDSFNKAYYIVSNE